MNLYSLKNKTRQSRNWLLTIALALLTQLPLVAQQNNSDCIADAIEKLYVTTNKNHTLAGDVIAYSLIVVNGRTHQLSTHSKIAYLQLIDASNQTILTVQSPITNGTASGSLAIPDTLLAGQYQIKAYTQWMTNVPDDYHFRLPLIIYPLSETPSETFIIGSNTKPDISVSTSAGNLVANFPNSLFVKINNPANHQNKVSVVNQNDSVVGFSTFNSNGFALIEFTPESNHVYNAQVKQNNGKTLSVPCPRVVEDGCILQITETDSTLTFQQFENNRQNTPTQIKIVHKQHTIVDTLLSSNNTFSVAKTKLPDGIFAAQLININGQIKTQRFYYNRSSNPQKPIVSITGQPIVRQPMHLSVQPDNAKNQSAITSVSVSKLSEIDLRIHKTSLDDYLYFWSELPNNLFEPLPASDFNNLLAGLQTNHYLWNNIAEEPINAKRENEGFVISGKIMTLPDSLPLTSTTLFLSAKTQGIALKYAITNNKGEFIFILNKGWYNKELILQCDPTLEINKKLVWHFNEKGINGITNSHTKLIVDSAFYNAVSAQSDIKLVHSVFFPDAISADTTHLYDEIPNHQLFNTKPGYTVVPADFEDLPTFEEVAANILPSVKFNKKKNGVVFNIYSSTTNNWLNNCLILLNGIPYGDLNYIATLGSKDIAKIEIYNTPLLWGDLYLTGVMAIYTNAGRIPSTYLQNNTHQLGIYFQNKVKEQYPDTHLLSNNKLPILNQSVLFQPFQHYNNTSAFSFIWPDLKGDYKLSVIGINSNGIPIETSQTISIK